MPAVNEEVLITIIASIGLFILLSAVIIRFLFLYQKKRFRHEEELIGMEKKYREEALSSQIEVQEQTRIYIARELHDNIGTLSSLVKMNLDLVESAPEEERKKNLLTESRELIRTLISDVKQLSLTLNTERVANLGITRLLQIEVDRLQKLKLFTIEYLFEGEEWDLPPDKQVILYRICQELLHNILKHSEATQVKVTAQFHPQRMRIVITDDGIGFNTQAAEKKEGHGGSGLINLNSRAKLIGATFFINSTPGNGTKCYIDVPFTQS